MGEYEHRQYGWWWLPLLLIGVAMPILTGGMLTGNADAQPIVWITGGVGFVLALAALMFVYLDVRDEGEVLAVRFGPLPPWGTSVRYEDIESIERMRTSLALARGLGVHGFPGWLVVFNIRGAEAVRIRLKRRRGLMMVKQIIIGTDDPENLLAFLLKKVDAAAA
jgi:hypothetical protein